MAVYGKELCWFTCQVAIPGMPVKLSSVGTVHSFQLQHLPPTSWDLLFLMLLSHCRWNSKTLQNSQKKKRIMTFICCFFCFVFRSAQNAFNQMTVLTTAKRRLYKQNSEDEFLLYPQRLSAMTVLLSGWLVLHCICLLTSLFIYRCLACNHCWHGTPWCKL